MKLSLGNQIRSNRLRLDMTQEQLAEKFGTSPQSISRWENGTTYPDIEMLPMIASYFGTTIDTLLGCTDEEKEKFCQNLQKSLTTATKEKDVEKTIEILQEIRRNLREYQQSLSRSGGEIPVLTSLTLTTLHQWFTCVTQICFLKGRIGCQLGKHLSTTCQPLAKLNNYLPTAC